MLYRLIVLDGPMSGQRITVAEEPMLIGTDAECAIRVPDAEMSARHATIQHAAQGLVVHDLGTMNRVLVNKRETRQAMLKHGDVVELGRTRFLVQAVVKSEVERTGRRLWRVHRKARWLAATALALALAAAYHVYRRGRAAPPEPPSAALPAAPAPAGPDLEAVKEVTQEIVYLREALADIRRTVSKLAVVPPAPPPTPAAVAAPNPAPAAAAPSTPSTPPAPAPAEKSDPWPDLQSEEVARLMEEAHQAAREQEFEAADLILAHLQRLAPEFLPAYEQRALLYERQGQLEKAMGQWLEIIQRSAVTGAYARAVSGRLRLLTENNQPPPPTTPQVKIASVDHFKFREGEGYQEMRILNIELAPEDRYQPPDARDIRVEVSFFDANHQSQSVALSRALTPPEPITPEATWNGNGQLQVSATYIVPREEPAAERPEKYLGYVVQVYYRNELQDERARPRHLLEAIRGAAITRERGPDPDARTAPPANPSST
jgi:tetratricopeptide (TPR) repeat protein